MNVHCNNLDVGAGYEKIMYKLSQKIMYKLPYKSGITTESLILVSIVCLKVEQHAIINR